MRGMDFSSWQGVLSTLFGLIVATLLMVGIRLLIMETVQQRRQRENRQINERLRTLIAAYKTLGGSFTGDLAVDPTHLRDLLKLRLPSLPTAVTSGDVLPAGDVSAMVRSDDPVSSDRARRIRDAVEAALSDVILLGNEEQVRLAAAAATDLAAGRPVRTDALVVSLRDIIRTVLDLEPVPPALTIPKQGPTRPSGSGGGGGGGKGRGGAGGEERGGGGGGGGGGRGGGGGGVGIGYGHAGAADDHERQ